MPSPVLGRAAGPRSPPQAPEPGLGGFQQSGVGGMLDPPQPLLWAPQQWGQAALAEPGSGFYWLDISHVPSAVPSDLLAMPWLCAIPGAGTRPAHASHADMLWVPEQAQLQPCPPVFWDQVKLNPVPKSKPSQNLDTWQGSCPGTGMCSTAHFQFITGSTPERGHKLIPPHTWDKKQQLLMGFPPFCWSTKQLHSLFSKSF